MSEKLATIVKVLNVVPVEKSDNLDCVRVLGWDVVCRRGDFKERDLGVYIEIDSITPAKEPFMFLSIRKYRIRTIKLRGCLSQGILFKLSEFPELGKVEEGDNVTEKLGIKKHEKSIPEDVKGYIKGIFPTRLVPKTDEERIQNVPRVLDELKRLAYWATIKIDGTSCTMLINENGELEVCSRNVSLKDGDNVYWRMAHQYKIDKILQNYITKDSNLCVQGEIAGPGIQKNRLKLKHEQFFVFDIYDMVKKSYYNNKQIEDFCKKNELQVVPMAFTGNSFKDTLEDLLCKAEGFYEGTSSEREGIVIRSCTNRYSRTLQGRLSFKVISNKFLLKNKE